MKKYKIKYQKGNDIFVEEIEVPEGIDPKYMFYMKDPFRDIISIEEVEE